MAKNLIFREGQIDDNSFPDYTFPSESENETVLSLINNSDKTFSIYKDNKILLPLAQPVFDLNNIEIINNNDNNNTNIINTKLTILKHLINYYSLWVIGFISLTSGGTPPEIYAGDNDFEIRTNSKGNLIEDNSGDDRLSAKQYIQTNRTNNNLNADIRAILQKEYKNNARSIWFWGSMSENTIGAIQNSLEQQLKWYFSEVDRLSNISEFFNNNSSFFQGINTWVKGYENNPLADAQGYSLDHYSALKNDIKTAWHNIKIEVEEDLKSNWCDQYTNDNLLPFYSMTEDGSKTYSLEEIINSFITTFFSMEYKGQLYWNGKPVSEKMLPLNTIIYICGIPSYENNNYRITAQLQNTKVNFYDTEDQLLTSNNVPITVQQIHKFYYTDKENKEGFYLLYNNQGG